MTKQDYARVLEEKIQEDFRMYAMFPECAEAVAQKLDRHERQLEELRKTLAASARA